MLCKPLCCSEALQNRCCTDQHRSPDPCGRVPSIAWSLNRYNTKNFSSLMKVFIFYVVKHFCTSHGRYMCLYQSWPLYVFVPVMAAICVCTSQGCYICLFHVCTSVFQTYKSCRAADRAQIVQSKHAMFRTNAERTDSLQFLHEDFQTVKYLHAACLRSSARR